VDIPPNSSESAPASVGSDVVALYHLDSDLSDATGKHASLTLQGNASLDDSNLSWMANRQGAALLFHDLGDKAIVQIPSADVRSDGTRAISLEAMVYVDAFVAYDREVAPIVSLSENWNALMALGEDKYAGPFIRGGTEMELIGSAVTSILTPKQWHHLVIQLDTTGYRVQLDGNTVKTMSSDELSNWGKASYTELQLGNFNGWIDEVVIRNIGSGSGSSPLPGQLGGATRFRLQLSGQSGQRYLLEASDNLLDWTPVATLTLTGRDLEWSDSTNHGLRQRFYRARLLLHGQRP